MEQREEEETAKGEKNRGGSERLRKVRLSRMGRQREIWIRGQDERKTAIGPVGGEQMLICAVFSAKVSLIRGEQVQISGYAVIKGIQ